MPPRAEIVKCRECKALYVSDRGKDRRCSSDRSFASFEKCPVCGFDDNRYRDTIPLWKYNLIRFFRGKFRRENE